MDINLGRKDKIIRDADIKKKFEEFSNGFFEDISMELYETEGKYFLNLAPYTDKILSSNMCITASSKSELESIIEDLSCNIGIMLSEKSGKMQKTETNKQTVQINGKEVSLLDFEQVYIEGENGKTELYKANELTKKIKSINLKVFSREKLDKESEVIYSRDEVSKLKSAVEIYKLQGNKEKVDEFSIKLESALRQYEYAKKELGMDKEQEKENIGQPGYSVEENEKKLLRINNKF